jgi:hypothetical protein
MARDDAKLQISVVAVACYSTNADVTRGGNNLVVVKVMLIASSAVHHSKKFPQVFKLQDLWPGIAA